MKSLIAQTQTDIVAVEPIDAGSRLYEAFLAGRSAQARRAYARDLIGFAVFLGEPTATAALSKILALSHGEANGALLAYRAVMAERGLTPATINHGLITDEEYDSAIAVGPVDPVSENADFRLPIEESSGIELPVGLTAANDHFEIEVGCYFAASANG